MLSPLPQQAFTIMESENVRPGEVPEDHLKEVFKLPLASEHFVQTQSFLGAHFVKQPEWISSIWTGSGRSMPPPQNLLAPILVAISQGISRGPHDHKSIDQKLLSLALLTGENNFGGYLNLTKIIPERFQVSVGKSKTRENIQGNLGRQLMCWGDF